MMTSISLDKAFVNFLKDYLVQHRIERIKEGKDTTVVSVVREGLILWAEKKGVLEELEKYLKQST